MYRASSYFGYSYLFGLRGSPIFLIEMWHAKAGMGLFLLCWNLCGSFCGIWLFSLDPCGYTKACFFCLLHAGAEPPSLQGLTRRPGREARLVHNESAQLASHFTAISGNWLTPGQNHSARGMNRVHVLSFHSVSERDDKSRASAFILL